MLNPKNFKLFFKKIIQALAYRVFAPYITF